VILADSSAWIEFLRRTGPPSHRALAQLAPGGRIAVTDPVVMEILAGVPGYQVGEHRARLLALPFVPVDSPSDFEGAAEIYRRCRDRGETIRSLIDCLIAAVAIREDAELLHNEADSRSSPGTRR
jgi:predicted nucleic acid-binding protein